MKEQVTPLQLDYILNGAKVYIYRRPMGDHYASLHDLSRMVTPAEVVRVKLTESSTGESVLSDPKVLEAIKRANR